MAIPSVMTTSALKAEHIVDVTPKVANDASNRVILAPTYFRTKENFQGILVIGAGDSVNIKVQTMFDEVEEFPVPNGRIFDWFPIKALEYVATGGATKIILGYNQT